MVTGGDKTHDELTALIIDILLQGRLARGSGNAGQKPEDEPDNPSWNHGYPQLGRRVYPHPGRCSGTV